MDADERTAGMSDIDFRLTLSDYKSSKRRILYGIVGLAFLCVMILFFLTHLALQFLNPQFADIYAVSFLGTALCECASELHNKILMRIIFYIIVPLVAIGCLLLYNLRVDDFEIMINRLNPDAMKRINEEIAKK